jgi:group I intron endonuclease
LERGISVIEIYKITNNVNGKVYIGQTSQGIRKRWSQHCCDGACPKLHKAIIKYGKKNFSVQRIDVAYSKEEANQKEMYWIEQYDSANHDNGYNLSLGGAFGNFNKETRAKMSDSHKGEKNYFYGKHHSEECRARMAELKKGVYTDGNHPRAKKVICVETGEVFDTIKEAAQKHGLSPQKISLVCIGTYGRNTTGGLHWKYAENRDSQTF